MSERTANASRARRAVLVTAALSSLCAVHCRRRSTTNHDVAIRELAADSGVAVDAGDAGTASSALPPLGKVERLVGTSWATCALTSTGRAWCFTDLNLPAQEMLEWSNVTDVAAGAREVLAKNNHTMCHAHWMCALMHSGKVACASSLKSSMVRALGGPPWGGETYSELPAFEYEACGGALDELAIDDAAWIGSLGTPKLWHRPICDDSEGSNDGLVIGRKDSVAFHVTYSGVTPCCEVAQGTCQPSSFSACSSSLTTPSRVVGWSAGLGLMEDGSWRDPPFNPGDEVKELRGIRAFAHGSPGAPYLCAIQPDGGLRCANEPQYGYECRPFVPKRVRPWHAWHAIPSIKGATGIAAGSGEGAACVLQNGVPWCWGVDGTLEIRTSNGLLGPRLGDDLCPLNDGTGQAEGCQKTPRRIEGIKDARQIVTAGWWTEPKTSAVHGNGFCVLDAAGQVICWGPNTKGLPRIIEPPQRDEH